jgi:hypothetical protein
VANSASEALFSKEAAAPMRMPMRRMPWPAYLWPGLPQLARDGNWAALAVAVAAAVLLNAVLLATCVWTEYVAAAPRIICWAFVGVAWSVSIGYWSWNDRQRAATLKTSDGNTFEAALEDYLKGNWFEAEQELNFLLRRDEHDIEARLLMATLLRRTKRFDEATNQLNILVGLDGAHRWSLEIHREGQLLTEAHTRSINSDSSDRENREE